MELRQIFKHLLRRWWLAATPVLVVIAYVALTFHSPAPAYQAVMRFSAGTEPAGLSVDYDRYYPWLTSEYIANALADVAVTQAFAQAVAGRLADQGLSLDPNALQANIATDNVQSVFVVYLNWNDPTQCAQIAEAVSSELTENAAAYFPQIAGVGVPARRLDAPRPALMAPSLRSRLLGPGLKLALAVAAGLGLVLLSYYLDPYVYERADLEALGIHALGAVPSIVPPAWKQLLG